MASRSKKPEEVLLKVDTLTDSEVPVVSSIVEKRQTVLQDLSPAYCLGNTGSETCQNVGGHGAFNLFPGSELHAGAIYIYNTPEKLYQLEHQHRDKQGKLIEQNSRLRKENKFLRTVNETSIQVTKDVLSEALNREKEMTTQLFNASTIDSQHTSAPIQRRQSDCQDISESGTQTSATSLDETLNNAKEETPPTSTNKKNSSEFEDVLKVDCEPDQYKDQCSKWLVFVANAVYLLRCIATIICGVWLLNMHDFFNQIPEKDATTLQKCTNLTIVISSVEGFIISILSLLLFCKRIVCKFRFICNMCFLISIVALDIGLIIKFLYPEIAHSHKNTQQYVLEGNLEMDFFESMFSSISEIVNLFSIFNYIFELFLVSACFLKLNSTILLKLVSVLINGTHKKQFNIEEIFDLEIKLSEPV